MRRCEEENPYLNLEISRGFWLSRDTMYRMNFTTATAGQIPGIGMVADVAQFI
jgi:hypothetical protein